MFVILKDNFPSTKLQFGVKLLMHKNVKIHNRKTQHHCASYAAMKADCLAPLISCVSGQKAALEHTAKTTEEDEKMSDKKSQMALWRGRGLQ